jgi:hypothetical protein
MTMQATKRKLMMSFLAVPVIAWLTACKVFSSGQNPPLSATQRRFEDMGMILVVDAVEGAEMLGVEFFADGIEFPFYARSLQKKTGRAIMAFPSGVVPEQVRVIWRANADEGYTDQYNGIRYSAPIVGDYTFPVASRIPDEIAKEIRKHGGGLRLKFRLKPDGVMFGWDIERFSGGLPRHSMPGGDFLETWY